MKIKQRVLFVSCLSNYDLVQHPLQEKEPDIDEAGYFLFDMQSKPAVPLM